MAVVEWKVLKATQHNAPDGDDESESPVANPMEESREEDLPSKWMAWEAYDGIKPIIQWYKQMSK